MYIYIYIYITCIYIVVVSEVLSNMNNSSLAFADCMATCHLDKPAGLADTDEVAHEVSLMVRHIWEFP